MEVRSYSYPILQEGLKQSGGQNIIRTRSKRLSVSTAMSLHSSQYEDYAPLLDLDSQEPQDIDECISSMAANDFFLYKIGFHLHEGIHND